MPPGYGSTGPSQGFLPQGSNRSVGGMRPSRGPSGRVPPGYSQTSFRGQPLQAAADGDFEAGQLQHGFPEKPLVPAGPSKLAQFAAVSKKPDFMVTWLVPLGIFSVNTLAFTYGFMQFPSVCILLAALFLISGIGMVSIRNRGHIWLPLGVALVVAAMVSTVTGLYVYDQFACFPAFYRNSRLYSNVVPSEPSPAIADAGKITFTSDASVDTNRSVAFVSESGYVYCIAPVRDTLPLPQVEFWAVGVQCCSIQGDFSCDSAKDPNAHAGIRVFDNSGWFGSSRKDYYEEARLKAEAMYSMVSATKPMYIRWVREDNLDMVSNLYAVRTVGNLFSFILMYAIGSALLAFALYRERARK